jgi:hypothetical protein
MSANGLGKGFENLTPADMSHALLVAILMDNGGHMDLPVSAFEADAIGGPDGSHHSVKVSPLPDGLSVRLSVMPRLGGADAVLRWQPDVPPSAQ